MNRSRTLSRARKIARFLAATVPFIYLYIAALWFVNMIGITVSEVHAFGLREILEATYFVFIIFTLGFFILGLIPTGFGYMLLIFYREQAAKKTTHAYIGWILSVFFNAFGPGLLFFTGLNELFFTGFTNFAGLLVLTLLLWVTLNFCLSVVALVDTLAH